MTPVAALRHRVGARPVDATADASVARYVPAPGALLRAPLLPIEDYCALCASSPDRRRQRAVEDPRIYEALAVGASGLLSALERPRGSAREQRRIDLKLLRYLGRMSSRPTPFGLFAGVAIARWGASTDVGIAAGSRPVRARPDMEWLVRWLAATERQPELRGKVPLVANSLAVARANRLYAVRAATSPGSEARAEVSVRNTPAVQRALVLARTAISIDDLTRTLHRESSGVDVARVESVVADLWERGFLMSALRPPLTSGNPVAHVLRQLEAIPEATDARDALWRLVDAAARWERCSSRPPRAFQSLTALANHLHADSSTPLQVDSALPLDACFLNEHVAKEAARAAELLVRLSPRARSTPELTAYRRAFVERYGAGREVPLLGLLDPELGLGALDTIPSVETDAQWSTARDATLMDLATKALRDRRPSVELDETLMAALGATAGLSHDAPVSLDISVFVAARSAAAIDAGDFRIIVGPNLGAPAAGRHVGRFAELLGERAVELLQSVQRVAPGAPAAIVDAELVYMPEPLRSANVAVRPSIHPFEIVHGTAPGVSRERVIPLEQLTISVQEDRFVVRWMASDVVVRIHEGHMLNPHAAPPVIRFLAEVARDGDVPFAPFDWRYARQFPYLPRVCSGRVVLCPAHWRVTSRTVAEWKAAPCPSDAVARWRAAWDVPRYVHVGYGDNRLLLDLELPEHVEELRAEAARSEQDGLLVQEALPAPDEHWLRGPGGRYAAEVVVPMMLDRREPRPSDARGVVRTPHHHAERLRPPGSEWLYLKLYCPRSAEDDVVVMHVAPMADRLCRDGSADRWFFVRYADPDPHLRIRLHGAPERLLRESLPALCALGADLMKDAACLRFGLDTYDREIDRFGGDRCLELVEEIFAADSRAVVRLLSATRRQRSSVDRRILAVVSVDQLLDAMGLDTHDRLRWFDAQTSPSDRHDAGPDYRTHKERLLDALSRGSLHATPSDGHAFLDGLAERRSAISALAPLLRIASRESGTDRLDGMLADLVHLHLNRLLGTAPAAERRVLAMALRAREALAKRSPSALPGVAHVG
jgi:thiopeptide-type bacteriocin biosynthesis protein